MSQVPAWIPTRIPNFVSDTVPQADTIPLSCVVAGGDDNAGAYAWLFTLDQLAYGTITLNGTDTYDLNEGGAPAATVYEFSRGQADGYAGDTEHTYSATFTPAAGGTPLVLTGTWSFVAVE